MFATEIFKKVAVDLVDCFRSQSQFQILEYFDKLFSVYQFDWRGSISSRLFPRVCGVSAVRHDDPFVDTPQPRVPKVGGMLALDRAGVAFALKRNFETYK